MSVVLDAWALIAFLDGEEPAAARVGAALAEGDSAACSINLGEALYRQMRTVGPSTARDGIRALREEMRIVETDWSLVEAAARVKARGGLSYANAFCVATAERLDAPLWTGDPEILALATEAELVDLR